MAQQINFRTLHISPTALIKRMLLGAVVGLSIISLFIFTVKQPNPEWGKFWYLKPLIVTPLITALGSLSFYLKNLVGTQAFWHNLLLIIISTFAFIFALWVGIILGLDGTLWD